MAYRSKADRPGTPAYRKKMAEKRAAEKAAKGSGSAFKGIAHIRDTHTPEGRPIKQRGTKPGTTKPRGVRAKPATQAEMDKQQRAKGPGRGSAPGSPGAKLDKAYRAVTGRPTKSTTTSKPGPMSAPKGETFGQAFKAGRAAAKKAGNAAGGTFSWTNKAGKTEKYKTWTAEEKAASKAGKTTEPKKTVESLWGRVKKAVGEPRTGVSKKTMKERQRQAKARRTAKAFPEGPTAQRLERDKRKRGR